MSKFKKGGVGVEIEYKEGPKIGNKKHAIKKFRASNTSYSARLRRGGDIEDYMEIIDDEIEDIHNKMDKILNYLELEKIKINIESPETQNKGFTAQDVEAAKKGQEEKTRREMQKEKEDNALHMVERKVVTHYPPPKIHNITRRTVGTVLKPIISSFGPFHPGKVHLVEEPVICVEHFQKPEYTSPVIVESTEKFIPRSRASKSHLNSPASGNWVTEGYPSPSKQQGQDEWTKEMTPLTRSCFKHGNDNGGKNQPDITKIGKNLLLSLKRTKGRRTASAKVSVNSGSNQSNYRNREKRMRFAKAMNDLRNQSAKYTSKRSKSGGRGIKPWDRSIGRSTDFKEYAEGSDTFTFQPHVNKKKRFKTKLDFQERQMRWLRGKEFHRRKMVEEKHRRELEGCTFQPRVNDSERFLSIAVSSFNRSAFLKYFLFSPRFSIFYSFSVSV